MQDDNICINLLSVQINKYKDSVKSDNNFHVSAGVEIMSEKNVQLRVLSKTIKELALSFNKEDLKTNFDNRLIYQKMIYLLQSSGVSLGYGFTWYVRGPYSTGLTQALFDIDDETFKDAQNLEFVNNDEILRRIHKVRDNLEKYNNDPTYLEVLGSLVFIIKSSGKNMSDEELKKVLLQKKPALKDKPDINLTMDTALNNIEMYIQT